MADKDLQQSQALLTTDKTRYVEIAPGVYALVAASVLLGATVDSSGNPQASTLTIDKITGAIAVIDTVHHQEHEAEAFTASYKAPDGTPIADDATVVFVITTSGSRWVHVAWKPNLGGDAQIEIFEDVVFNGGTQVPVRNKKRTAVTAAGDEGNTASVLLNPTILDPGENLLDEFIPGGTGGTSQGGGADERDEFILKLSSSYMFRLTNRAGTAQPASMRLRWYEESSN